MTKIVLAAVVLVFSGVAVSWGQGHRPAGPAAFSHRYLKAQQYSSEDNAQILKLYKGLRESDVIDGLDAVGLQETTMMNPRIRPIWRDKKTFKHRIQGIAVTIHLVPAQETSPTFTSEAQEQKWESIWGPPAEMRTDNPPKGSFTSQIHPGTVLVIDNEAHDNGFCGSNDALSWRAKGMIGIVGNAVCRDTDELALTQIPVYQNLLKWPRGINQGRMWMESYNEPIVVGGVLVMPGDVIVADGDGVAVVPRRVAKEVARFARWDFENDEATRQKLYRLDKMPLDWTVEGHTTPPAQDMPITPAKQQVH